MNPSGPPYPSARQRLKAAKALMEQQDAYLKRLEQYVREAESSRTQLRDWLLDVRRRLQLSADRHPDDTELSDVMGELKDIAKDIEAALQGAP